MESTVIYESKDELFYLTLNRPEVFNALNLQLVRDLMVALKRAESEQEVRVVILKGAGKAWCAGGDLEELLKLTEGSASDRRGYLVAFKEKRQPVFRP
ncbi:MAG: enoyl-CoA hydratase/isomerase family protein [Desulfatiglandales bacterium]